MIMLGVISANRSSLIISNNSLMNRTIEKKINFRSTKYFFVVKFLALVVLFCYNAYVYMGQYSR